MRGTEHEKELIMIEKLKMVQVREKEHRAIKELAGKRYMSIKDYVEYLVELDREIIAKEEHVK